MKNGLKLTKDETDRKKGRSWKEGELRRVSMEGLVVAHSRFIINVIVFFLLDNFFTIFSILSSTFLQHSIFEASERIFWSDVQNTSETEC